jgi:hypothetical protein
VRTSVSSADPTNGLRTYRGITLQDVTDQRVGSFAVTRGNGTLAAPQDASERSPPATAQPGDPSDRTGEDGLAGLFEDASAGEGVFVLMLFAAFGWGALHALSPGHGKAMVAAYLVGTRGAPRHAVALGGIVTVTHTIGVFALGLVTLLLSQWILPEDLYPWLNLAAGLLIVAVGLSIVASRVRWARPTPGTRTTTRTSTSRTHTPMPIRSTRPGADWPGWASRPASSRVPARSSCCSRRSRRRRSAWASS